MRTRLRRRLLLKKIIAGLFLAAAIPLAAGGLLWAMPQISGIVARAGVISAGLALPEGGLALLQGFGQQEEELPSQVSTETHSASSEISELQEESQLSSEPIQEESVSEPEPQPEPYVAEENRATLIHKTYTTAPSDIYIPLENGYIKNCTSLSREELVKQVQNPPDFSISDDGPQVLVMHTHTTESYIPFTGDYYDKTMSFRSTDNTQNMSAVGDKIVEQLEAAGIQVLHDVTQHDYPSYNGSYERSRVTVQKYLEQYPSIKVVLDIHRDAIVSGDTVTAPVAEIDGRTAAQVMIISGCDDGTMGFPNYMQNLHFSAALQNQLEGDYPGLTRPVLFDYRLYNQDLTSGSILIEVGGHGNTLEQACYSGELIGKALGELLNRLKQ